MSTPKKPGVTVADHHFIVKPDGTWEKRPGGFIVGMSFTAMGEAESKAAELAAANPKLSASARLITQRRLAAFFDAHRQLKEYLSTPLGNIAVQEDSAELRNLWHLYLMTGRELIDSIGHIIHTCFGLKQPLNGLNAKKLQALRLTVEKLKQKLPSMESLMLCLDKYEILLTDFISLRDRDKTHGDTIKEPPTISATGVASGGRIVSYNFNNEFVFAEYVNTSFEAIIGFARFVLLPQNTEK